MILDLEPIFNNEGMVKQFNYELDLSEQELNGSKPFASSVKFSGHAGNYTGIVELHATAEFVLDTACDRCAKPISLPLATKIFHTLVTSLNDETNDELLLAYRILPKTLAADTFVEMEPDDQKTLIKSFSDSELKSVLDELFVDDAVDILEEMPANVVKRILRFTDAETRKNINDILKTLKEKGKIRN